MQVVTFTFFDTKINIYSKMKKIIYLVATSLLLGLWSCTNTEEINIPESNQIPRDTINIYANDSDVVWDEDLGWVHVNCVESF